MKKNNLRVYYDEEGDFLEIGIGKPVKGYFKDLGDDIFERRDEKTDEIKGYAIFNFKKRTKKLKDINISLPEELKIISS
tara:strand:- start:499 stop:735 length:237 start_codon:yes stop_codon:yes gene_type:complete